MSIKFLSNYQKNYYTEVFHAIVLQFIGADLETLLFIMILIHGLKKLNHQCIK